MTAVLEQAYADLGKPLDKGLNELGLALGRDVPSRLLEYLALLDKWNRIYNLTAIRGGARSVSGHLLDCLAVVPHVTGARVLDVGSGAGLPGIPIALAKPEARVTLLDSNHKKAAFLRQAVVELQLKNVNVICERVENWRPPDKFDCIISRAFAEIAEFVASASHLLAPGGIFASMKGVHPYDEIERLPHDFRVKEVLRLRVPMLAAERHLVLIEHA